MKRAILRYVSLGIDVEPDCPPYLATQYRGVTDGLPKLLDVLDAWGVRTTCFCTGQVAERFPLFPLGLVLLPTEIVPLHIFEERYKLMIGRCIEEETEFGIVWLAEGGLRVDASDAPSVRVERAVQDAEDPCEHEAQHGQRDQQLGESDPRDTAPRAHDAAQPRSRRESRQCPFFCAYPT